MQSLNVTVMTWSGPSGLDLTITDLTSGLEIVRLELTPEQVYQFIQGSSVDPLAAKVMSSADGALLGYHHTAYLRMFQVADHEATRQVRDGKTPESWTRWAEEVKQRLWARTVIFSARAGGVAVTVRRYDATQLSEEMYRNVQATLDAIDPPEGLLPFVKREV